MGISQAVQWLNLYAYTAGVECLILGKGTKIPACYDPASWVTKKKKKKHLSCYIYLLQVKIIDYPLKNMLSLFIYWHPPAPVSQFLCLIPVLKQRYVNFLVLFIL